MPSFRGAFVIFLGFLLLAGVFPAVAQSAHSGTITGTVTDTSGAVIPGATVHLENPISGFSRDAQTDASGQFQLTNLPYASYHVTAQASGFTASAQDASVHSAIPVTLSWKLNVAAAATTVTVEADQQDIIQKTDTAATDIDSSSIGKIPTESTNSGLSSLITLATPGVAQDSNGLFHPQGEHADTSFSVDGQPVTDQQSRQFSNQLALGAIQSLHVISGVAPAEYGDKASLVIETTTKSGLGQGRPHGALSYGYGSFGTSTFSANVGVGSQQWGSFTTFDGTVSSRFLDTPEFQPIHDHGNVGGFFERLDWQTTQKDSFHLNLGASRSWAQTPNQYDQQEAGQDQRQEIKNFNIAPTYTHLFNQYALLNANAWVRQDQVHYYPSADIFSDSPATLRSSRRLTNFGIKVDLAYDRGIHSFKSGVSLVHTPLTEAFSIGITNPAFNAPCIGVNGPITDPSVTPPCTGYAPNPNYLPGEAQYDLTRGGHIGTFGGHTDIKQEALFLQDEIRWKNWTGSAGIRADNYNGITSRSLIQPRAGVSYNIPLTGTLIRGSYGKFFLTPYNENLIVSSQTGNGGLANNLGAFGQVPLRPATRNMFSSGLEQALGKYVVVTADYFWKFTNRDYDFDIVLNSPLAFPIEWRKSKIDGYAVRVNMAPFHGVTAYSVLGHTRSRFFGPETGGIIFNDPAKTTSRAPFRIDHDQNFQQTTHFQWQPKKEGAWYGFNWTYESGLVAGNAPFATDSTTPVDLTYLTPDQQAQVEVTCGGVRATRSAPLTSCAPNQLSSPLLQIPKPGTENDDRNPPRIAPRHVFDMSAGYDNIFHHDKLKTDLSFTVVNLTNQYSLYNFLSTFSGTHFVAPRTYTAQMTFNF